MIMKPFMLADDHSINAMASDEDDSLKSILKKPHSNRK
jgi:cobalamin biosynthesis Co2+ chelatase CbiK